MMLPVVLIILIAGSVMFSWLAKRSVMELSEGEVSIPKRLMILSALLTSLPAAALAGSNMSLTDALLCCSVLLMALLALTDQQSAWAPDALTYPLIGLSGAFALQDVSLVLGLAIGLGGYAALQRVFPAVQSAWANCPPPPDLLAFIIGPMLLGFSGYYLGAMMLSSVVLAVLRQSPGLASAAFSKDVMDAAHKDLGYVSDDTPIPLLAVLFPINILAILASLYFGSDILIGF